MLTSNGYVLEERPARLGGLAPVPAAERGSAPALRSRLAEHGYLYLTRHLPVDVVAGFRRYYFGVLEPTGLTASDGEAGIGLATRTPDEIDHAELRHRLFGTVVPGPEYQALCTTPAVRDWFGWLLDAEVHLHRRKILRHTLPQEHEQPRTRGVGSATQAHYDLLYLREGSDRVLSMWIPLGPCPVEMGGLVYLEGSHRRMRAAERAAVRKRPAASITADLPGLADEQDARWLCADYSPGDVVVHDAYLVHAALDNVDTGRRIRLSTDIRYQRASDGIDARWQQHWHDTDGL